MRKLGVLLLVGISSLSLLPAIAEEVLKKGQELVTPLRQGGYVILIRHAAGNKDQKDADKVDLNNCDTQRNLSREGRMDSRQIGQAMDTLQIPVGKVLASPFCRAMDTGRLAFSRVKPFQALNYVTTSSEDEKKAASLLKPLLANRPAVGTNTVLISHSTNIKAALGFVPEEGEALIFKPEGNNNYKLVGRIRVQEWSSLMP
ncbi:hypothetical protein BST81_14965 [Leptolyngbya sp. 'hensonii']|uniref:histidine phosphatase family protein n=1 Tax=Leptolyngbya sp. 'hensonii' TaxID=1922337 RepID=UPI0009617A45|nr:histidine phosphatase family protein [Leptolyngbya sp. 'hensonii']OLP17623.1 hypothetical protein BST81_14965 [Leptolyngbya sp. 'hensonii']